MRDSEPSFSELEKVTPLPKLQVSILLFLQLAEPLVSQVILPFVNDVSSIHPREMYTLQLQMIVILQLVSELDITGGDAAKTGFYSGLLVRHKVKPRLYESNLIGEGFPDHYCRCLCSMLQKRRSRSIGHDCQTALAGSQSSWLDCQAYVYP